MNKMCPTCKGHKSVTGMGHIKKKCPCCKGTGIMIAVKIEPKKPEVKKSIPKKKPAAKKKAKK